MARTLTLPSSVGEILFRLPDELETFEILGGLPVLQTRIKEELEVIGPGAEARKHDALREVVGRVNTTLCRLAKKPRLTEEDVASTADLVDVKDLSIIERVEMFRAIWRAVGFSKEEAERIRPLSRRAATSQPSTPLEGATESVPQR